MSSVHYKFRSLVTYKTINFNALEISVEDVKQRIFAADALNPELFDLIVENALFKREYSGRDMIPRNAALSIKRIPRLDAGRLPKIQDTTNSGIVKHRGADPAQSFASTADFSNMTEAERLEHVKRVSCQKYDQSNYQKRARYSADTPPASHICNRCNQPGHWIKNCPLINMKRTTGIPMEDLIETTADDPHAMLHPSGRYMAQRMHVNARLNSKAKAPIPFIRDAAVKDENAKPVSPSNSEPESPPSALVCPQCCSLFNDAVVLVCCGWTYCATCVMNLILEKPGRQCSGPGCTEQLRVDSMIPADKIRKLVHDYKVEKESQNCVNTDPTAFGYPFLAGRKRAYS